MTNRFCNTVVLLLGGNLGNRFENIEQAKNQIRLNIGKEIIASEYYESEAWGFASDCNFINQAIVVETILSPQKLLETTQLIEKQIGRKSKSIDGIYSSRLIDIDILFYNSSVINLPKLTIPHPQMQNRMFTMLPLADVVPDFVHPLINKSNKELLNACRDKSKVWRTFYNTYM